MASSIRIGARGFLTSLIQNFPGPGTKSTNDDGTPMHNWWVYLFY